MKKIKFEDCKERIVAELLARHEIMPYDKNGYILVEGFLEQQVLSESSDNIVLGGPSLPMIALIGESTGLVFYFSAKILLPDLEF